MRDRAMWLVLTLLSTALTLGAEGEITVPRDEATTADFEKSRAAAEQSRWDEAVEGFQAILERKGPVEDFVAENAVFARGWRQAAREALLTLPEKGREAYQRLVGAKAAEALAAAEGKREALWEVERTYPASDAAWEARRILAGEGAPPREALRVLEDLLDHDPSPARDIAATAMRIADLAASIGETGRILLLARRAKKEWPDAKATVDGREASLEAALRARATSTKPEPRKDWPRWGGGLDGAGVFPAVRQVTRFLWSQEINEGNVPSDAPVQAIGAGGPGPASAPVVAGDRLYLIAGDTVYCKDLARGNHVWSYRVPPPSNVIVGRAWVGRDDGIVEPNPSPPCVHDGLIAFEYGRQRYGEADARGRASLPFSEVHVLDAQNGKLLWKWRTDKDEAFKKASLSCPILTPEGLYTLAVSTEGARKATLLAFDRESGERPRWQRLLVTVPGGASPWNAFQRPADAILGYADGAIVVATNLGVVAAVDAKSGDVLWTFAYGSPAAVERGTEQKGWIDARRANPLPSWTIVADGVVLFGAADTPWAWCLAPRTGKRLWNNAVSPAMTPSGYGGGTLYVAGAEMYVLDVATGKRVWHPGGGTSTRAAIAANGCLCWGDHGLSLRRCEDGQETAAYDWTPSNLSPLSPSARDYIPPEPTGAILPLGDRILLQAPGRLYCFLLEDPLPPPEDLADRIVEWIAQLSSPKYAERHRAAEALLEAGPSAEEKLREAKASTDREVSWRAEEVLRAMEKSRMLVRRLPKKQK